MCSLATVALGLPTSGAVTDSVDGADAENATLIQSKPTARNRRSRRSSRYDKNCRPAALHQVEQREQEDPHDVDEVPVEAEELYRTVILEVGVDAYDPIDHEHGDENAENHVQCV